MQSPSRVTTTSAYEISGRVLVNGTDIGAHVISVDIGRDIPDALPGSSGGFRSASATVLADLSGTAETTTPHPWDGVASWPPTPADTVEVWLSDGENEWCQIVGTIDDPEGSTDDTRVRFTVNDRYARLYKPVRIPALSNAMPPQADATTWLYVGMQPIWLADCVMRQVGRFATPSNQAGTFVSVPMMGSTWPQYGTLRRSIRRREDDIASSYPSFVKTAYGMAAHNVDITIIPFSWSQSDLRFNRPIEVTQELPDNDASTFIMLQFDKGRLEVSCNASTAYARYNPDSGSSIDITSRARMDHQRVTVRFTRSGDSVTAQIRLANHDGSNVSAITEGTITRNSGDLAGEIESVRAYSLGTLGAFQVTHPTNEWSRLRYKPNVTFNVSGVLTNLIGIPETLDVMGGDFLSRIADAEMASWWIDENDVLQWWDRTRFRTRPNVAILNAANHITRIPWRHTGGSQVQHVRVDYKHPHKTQRWRTNLALWQGGNSTLEQGDDDETIVSTPSDEVWLGVSTDDAVRYNANTSNYWAINRGVRTVMGGIAVSEGGDERVTNSILPTVRRISDSTWAFNTRITALQPDETAAIEFPSDFSTDTRLWQRWRGDKLPILRGMGKVVFEDASHTAAQTGPVNTADYRHDAGWMIQSATPARRVADYLAEYATVPTYQVDGVEIMPVLNLQVGDTITLDDPTVMGVQIRGIITSNTISANFGAGSLSQSLNLRVIDVTRHGREWAEFGSSQSGDTWGEFGAQRSGQTWADFGDNPLKEGN